jgi:hypothetical protein
MFNKCNKSVVMAIYKYFFYLQYENLFHEKKLNEPECGIIIVCRLTTYHGENEYSCWQAFKFELDQHIELKLPPVMLLLWQTRG